jgi:hypothetical protein
MDMPKLCITLFVKNYSDEVKKRLFLELEKECTKKWPGLNMEVRWVRSEEYWKIPELTECFLNIYAESFITVTELAGVFDLKWDYSSGECMSIRDGVKCVYTDSDICWDSRIDGKTFLIDEVTWVNVCSNSIDLDFEYDLGSDFD